MYHLLYPLTGECLARDMLNSFSLIACSLVFEVVIMHFLVYPPQHDTEFVLLTGIL